MSGNFTPVRSEHPIRLIRPAPSEAQFSSRDSSQQVATLNNSVLTLSLSHSNGGLPRLSPLPFVHSGSRFTSGLTMTSSQVCLDWSAVPFPADISLKSFIFSYHINVHAWRGGSNPGLLVPFVGYTTGNPAGTSGFLSVSGVSLLSSQVSQVDCISTRCIGFLSSSGQLLFDTSLYADTPTRYLIFGCYWDNFGIALSNTNFVMPTSLSGWLYTSPLPFFDPEA